MQVYFKVDSFFSQVNIKLFFHGVDTVYAGTSYVYPTLPTKYDQNAWVDEVDAFLTLSGLSLCLS